MPPVVPESALSALAARPPRSLSVLSLRAEAPLAGLTILAVEDSRFASDALRLMCQRAGGRLRRAETLALATAHLRLYRPDVVLVDLGLPDGDGADLIATLARHGRGGPLVVGMSGEDGAAAALAAGAQGFLLKPVERLADFCDALLAHLPDRAWLRGLPGGAPLARPDPLALRDDLAVAARRLAAGPDAREGRYLAGFVAGLARASRDEALAQAAGAARRGSEADLAAALGTLARALALRLGARRASEMMAPGG